MADTASPERYDPARRRNEDSPRRRLRGLSVEPLRSSRDRRSYAASYPIRRQRHGRRAVSVQATTAVFLHSRSTGAARLVLLALADEAASTGEASAYARSQNHLASKANADKRTVGRALVTLVEIGELEILAAGDGRIQASYQIHLPGLEGGRLAHPAGEAEGRQVAHPGSAHRPPWVGTPPTPSSRSPRADPSEENLPATPDGDGGQLELIEPIATTKDRARWLMQRVYENRSPRPSAPFPALAKIAKSLLDAGHTDEAVEQAFMETLSFTRGALEFQLNGGRNGRPNHVIDSGPPREAWDIEGAFFNQEVPHGR